jgi:hypothetical protein
MPSRSPMSASSRAFCFVYLSPQKHLGGNATSVSFTRRRDMGSSGLTKVGPCCAVWHFVLSEVICIMSHDIKGDLHLRWAALGNVPKKHVDHWIHGGQNLYLLSFFSHLIVCFTRKAFQRLPDKSEPCQRRKFLKWLNAEYARKASNITLEYRHSS